MTAAIKAFQERPFDTALVASAVLLIVGGAAGILIVGGLRLIAG